GRMSRRNHGSGRRPSSASRDKYLKQRARSVPTVWKPATGAPMANRKAFRCAAGATAIGDGLGGTGGGMKVLRPERSSARMLPSHGSRGMPRATAAVRSIRYGADTGRETGKKFVARAIHSASHRHDKPLIKVNCTALPASLVESEFVRPRKGGAFSG